MFLFDILQDAFFAAIAAIGFASISNPPRIAFVHCALLAAIGHATRYVLMNNQAAPVSIITASLCGALLIGFLAIYVAPRVKCPPETLSYPALLPMIPGMYAYRTVQAIALCLSDKTEGHFMHYQYLFCYNGLTCSFIILALVLGVTLPIMIMKKASFTSTK